MKNSITIFLLFFAVFKSYSQFSLSELEEDLNRTGGVYYAYPTETADNTPAPEGYVPFYISHYGRHGSRYLISDNDTKWVVELLEKAKMDSALTPLGLKLKNKIDSIWEESQGKGGDLSPLGVRQHKSIAKRMYRNYPEVFGDDAKLTARSTLVVRCVLSMAAFCESLKENNPQINIERESSQKYMPYLCYSTPESNDFNGKNGWVQQMIKNFRDKTIKPERFVNSVFSDSTYISRHVDPSNFMWGIYWIASDAQNTENKISLYDFFEPQELMGLWQCFNADFYSRHANFKASHGKHLNNAKPLLRNFLESAQAAVSGKGTAADLRFGHDGNVVPFVALLGFDNCGGCAENPEEFYKVWMDWKVSPMAANIQMILFRNPKNYRNDILVKFLHNEKETHIPIATDIWPYYKWEDVVGYYEGILKK